MWDSFSWDNLSWDTLSWDQAEEWEEDEDCPKLLDVPYYRDGNG